MHLGVREAFGVDLALRLEGLAWTCTVKALEFHKPEWARDYNPGLTMWLHDGTLQAHVQILLTAESINVTLRDVVLPSKDDTYYEVNLPDYHLGQSSMITWLIDSWRLHILLLARDAAVSGLAFSVPLPELANGATTASTSVTATNTVEKCIASTLYRGSLYGGLPL